MNTTPIEKQIQILNALVEGNSIRSTERMTGVHRDTIMRLLVRIGDKCEKLMNEKMRHFHCKRLEIDEIWTFIKKKERRLTAREKAKQTMGDQFVYVALDADTKLIPVFTIGKRNRETTLRFIESLHSKLNGNGRVQLTSDGFKPYIDAIEQVFGINVDFAQLTKVYSAEPSGRGRYAPPSVAEVLSKIITGNPNPKKISTSYVERQNLTMRMQMRRFTRLTNAFSKKLKNLRAAIALHFAHYNFCRIHSSLRVTPAMEAGISNHVWDMKEIVSL